VTFHILAVAGLLAHQHDARIGRTFAEHRLRRAKIQRASATILHGGAQRRWSETARKKWFRSWIFLPGHLDSLTASFCAASHTNEP
jgi:hypothetical protein